MKLMRCCSHSSASDLSLGGFQWICAPTVPYRTSGCNSAAVRITPLEYISECRTHESFHTRVKLWNEYMMACCSK